MMMIIMVMRGDDYEGDDHDEDDEDADYELVMMIMLVLTLEGPSCALGGSSSSHGGVLGRSWRLVGGFLARSWVAPGARPKSLSKSEAPTWQTPPFARWISFVFTSILGSVWRV